jgi:hypothetical protein
MEGIQNTDEQRLAEFSQKLDSFKPEGFDEESFARLKESMVNFHKSEVTGLKINSVKMKEEKEKLSQKCQSLEAELGSSSDELKTLQEKLAANQPEELRKQYENQHAQLNERFSKQEAEYKSTIEQQNLLIKELQQGVLERDVLAEFNKIASTKNWLGGGREACQQILLGQNCGNFSRLKMPDGTTLLVNKDQQDISQALDKFLDTELGKTLLKFDTSGGGADGSGTANLGKKKISEAQYLAMSPQEQMDAVLNGLY